jgi:hypothetical protein
MLKTLDAETVWLVDQPAHGLLAGTLAAHWGNDQFARPGSFGRGVDPERLRKEVVLAVTQHDNGWWEWEAAPQEGADGLPKGLQEVLGHPREGMDRWRLGVKRLAQEHPYASLLISDHASWLYAAQFEDDFPDELVHPIQKERRRYPAELKELVAEFRGEMAAVQAELEARLQADPFWASALKQRLPHSRLLQILDAFSLALTSAVLGPRGLGRDPLVFSDVPARSWEQRVELHWTPLGDNRIALDPFPFGKVPLDVAVPARHVQQGRWWREAGMEMLNFRLEPGS